MPTNHKHRRHGLLRRFLKSRKFKVLLILGVAALIAIPIGTYAYFANDLDSKEEIMNRKDTGLTLFDRNGQPYYTFYEAQNRSLVTLDQVPDHLEQALVASEDKDFYEHAGYNLRSIGAAFYANILNKELRYGGSTITQQLVKNSLLTRKKSFLRKYQELVLAIEIDRRFSKEEILEMYLNSVYFGEGAFGVEAAAQTYFSKPASELTLAESSLLIGLLPAPSALSPITGDAEGAKQQQEEVLAKMTELQKISDEEKQVALAEALQYQPLGNGTNLRAHHFAFMVRDELVRLYGEERVARSGFRVKTTVDLEWQTKAEEELTRQLTSLVDSQVSNGAVVVEDPKTGEIKALVGSRDWNDEQYGKVNMAISPRQPGSSFKPLYYMAAIDKGTITAATVLHDKPVTYEDGYSPQNFDKQFRGDVLARKALANSLNVPAVEVMQKFGVAEALEAAESYGITTLEDADRYGLTLALGAGEVKLTEMTNAYAMMANLGQKPEQTMVLSIEEKDGEKIFEHKVRLEKVLNQEAPYVLSHILSDNAARRETFADRLTISRPAAVKTGSTEDYRDAWTIGYTPSLVVGVWIGNNDDTPMTNVAGSFGAGPVWRNLMEHYLAGSAVEEFARPAGIVEKAICQNGALAVQEGNGTFKEIFIISKEPSEKCNEKKQEKPREDGDDERRRREEDERREQDENENNGNGNGNGGTGGGQAGGNPGGPPDGGTTDGGETDVGNTDGGTTDGGTTDGGTTDGGTTDGTTDGPEPTAVQD